MNCRAFSHILQITGIYVLSMIIFSPSSASASLFHHNAAIANPLTQFAAFKKMGHKIFNRDPVVNVRHRNNDQSTDEKSEIFLEKILSPSNHLDRALSDPNSYLFDDFLLDIPFVHRSKSRSPNMEWQPFSLLSWRDLSLHMAPMAQRLPQTPLPIDEIGRNWIVSLECDF